MKRQKNLSLYFLLYETFFLSFTSHFKSTWCINYTITYIYIQLSNRGYARSQMIFGLATFEFCLRHLSAKAALKLGLAAQ